MSFPNRKLHNNSYESNESSITSLSSSAETTDKSLNRTSLVTLLVPSQLDISFDDAFEPGQEIVLSSQGSELNTYTSHKNQEHHFDGLSALHRKMSVYESADSCVSSEEIGYQSLKEFKIVLERLPDNLDVVGTDTFLSLECAEYGVELGSSTGLLVTEDSCNAVDNKLSNEPITDLKNVDELSFNGKIDSLPSTSAKCFQDPINRPSEINAKLLTKYSTANIIYTNERSPDIFASDDDSDDDECNNVNESSDSRLFVVEENQSVEEAVGSLKKNSSSEIECDILNEEIVQLKRVNSAMSGVLPPPSVTTMPLDINQLLRLYKYNNQHNAIYENKLQNENRDQEGDTGKMLSKPKHSVEQAIETEWPAVLNIKTHGLSYNRSPITEKLDDLSLRYIDRYVSAQTVSSFATTQSPSSSRKRNLRKQLLRQSPGNRLSHLAKRRAMFSSANLLMKTQNSSSQHQALNPSKLCNRQIVVNTAKRTGFLNKKKGKTPKRLASGPAVSVGIKSPKSMKKTQTVAQKSIVETVVSSGSTLTRETSKRALFQSPPKEQSLPLVRPPISAELASRAARSRRVLFSPTGKHDLNPMRYSSMVELNNLSRNRFCSQPTTSSSASMSHLYRSDSEMSLKRSRCDENDEQHHGVLKYARLDLSSTDDEKQTPNSLKFARSQSFCVASTAPRASTSATLTIENPHGSLFRTNSEMLSTTSQPQYRPPLQLSDNHKKKLLWAVSQALQSRKIDVKHEKFKEYASVLARVTKRVFLEGNPSGQCGGGSTSEKMIRLTNNLVYDVTQGKSVDQIYLAEKMRLEKRIQNKTTRPQGYIAPNDSEGRQKHLLMKQRTASSMSSVSSVISENSFDSFSSMQFNTGSQSSGIGLTQYFSQSSEHLPEYGSLSSQGSRIETAPLLRLTNSSSKNNESGTALRENFDSEQRKSNQKNGNFTFSGKDQKNVSPYLQKMSGQRLLAGGNSMLKAKRQISFDS